MDSKTKQTIVSSLLVVMSSLLSAETIAPDRPGAGESSSVMAPGFAQIETGIKTFDDANAENGTEYGGTVVRFGVIEDWELRLGWGGHLDSEPVSGSKDGLLGFKYSICSGGDTVKQPEMALIVQSTVPLGDSDITSDKFDPTFLLASTHTLTDAFSLSYNLGLGVGTSEKGDGSLTTLSSGIYTLALGYSATDQLSFFAEIFGQAGLSAKDAPTSFDCGVAYLINDNSQLDLSVGAALNSDAEDFFVSFGYSFMWGM